MNRIQVAGFSLIASAFVLGALLLVQVQNHLPPAQASLLLTHDDYTMLTAQTKSNEDSLFITDSFNEKLLIYNVDVKGKGGRLELIKVEDLTKLFEFNGGGAGGPARVRP